MPPLSTLLPLAQALPPAPPQADGRPILALVLIGLSLAAGISSAVWWWRRRSRPSAESTCGKCGYGVTGLPSFVCPECGSDLRAVGIVRGYSRPAGWTPRRETVRLYAILAAWTLVYGAMYVFLGARSYPYTPWDPAARSVEYGLVDAYLWPYRGRSTHTVTLEPSSGAYRRIIVTERREARFLGWRNAPVVHWTGDSANVGLTKFEISLRLDTLDGRSATMDIDATDLSFRYADPRDDAKVTAGKAVDGPVIWGWMLQNGVDMPSPVVKEEAGTVADLVRKSVSSGFVGGSLWANGRLERIAALQRDSITNVEVTYPFTTMRGTAQDTYGPGWSIYWLSIPFGLGLYSYGANWIWARHKRRGGNVVGAALPAVEATPARSRVSRTLTILFTDMKDYTARAASTSRQGLMAMLARNRDVVESAVDGHEGRIVKTIGDAYLVTFESATNAVLAGCDIQRAAARANAQTPSDDERLELRVGVATGEVTLAADGDVFGTAVNVASRVQGLARVGEVYFTESTYHAMNAAEVPHAEVGPRELKGIATPVRVFRALHS